MWTLEEGTRPERTSYYRTRPRFARLHRKRRRGVGLRKGIRGVWNPTILCSGTDFGRWSQIYDDVGIMVVSGVAGEAETVKRRGSRELTRDAVSTAAGFSVSPLSNYECNEARTGTGRSGLGVLRVYGRVSFPLLLPMCFARSFFTPPNSCLDLRKHDRRRRAPNHPPTHPPTHRGVGLILEAVRVADRAPRQPSATHQVPGAAVLEYSLASFMSCE